MSSRSAPATARSHHGCPLERRREERRCLVELVSELWGNGGTAKVCRVAKVTRFGDESAVVVDRYDRQIKGSEIVRVHQEDLCQALGVLPSGKYQNEGGLGPADIANLLRRVMAPQVAADAVRRFADALIWNWLIAGTDAHAKNYSLLLADNQVRLAPLYDIASSLPYCVHEKKLRLAMKIGGDYGVFPHRTRGPPPPETLALTPTLWCAGFVNWPRWHRTRSPRPPMPLTSQSLIGTCPADWSISSPTGLRGACS
jgi:hypothetical protein